MSDRQRSFCQPCWCFSLLALALPGTGTCLYFRSCSCFYSCWPGCARPHPTVAVEGRECARSKACWRACSMPPSASEPEMGCPLHCASAVLASDVRSLSLLVRFAGVDGEMMARRT